MSWKWSSFFGGNRRKDAGTLTMMLIGRTGNGRSSTANSIMKKTRFTSAASAVSVTRETDHDVCEINNRRIHVLDGPGIKFVRTDEESASKSWVLEMAKAIAFSPEGINAFLIVLKIINRFTDEEKYAIKYLKTYFGSDFIKKYGIIVMTGGDTYERLNKEVPFQKWCKDQQGPFKELLVECDNRVVLFNNVTGTECVKDEQLKELLGLVDQIYRRQGKRYTNKHFQKTKEAREHLLKEEIPPIVWDEILQELSIIIQALETIVKSELRDGAKLEECEKLIARIEPLEKNKPGHGKSLQTRDQLLTEITPNLLQYKDVLSERQCILSAYSEDKIIQMVQADRMKRDELIERRLEEEEIGSFSRLQQRNDFLKSRCDILNHEIVEKKQRLLTANRISETRFKESVDDLFITYLQAKNRNDEEIINTLIEIHVFFSEPASSGT